MVKITKPSIFPNFVRKKELRPYQDKFEWVNVLSIQRLVINLRPNDGFK
jgi:hypothetical protein